MFDIFNFSRKRTPIEAAVFFVLHAVVIFVGAFLLGIIFVLPLALLLGAGGNTAMGMIGASIGRVIVSIAAIAYVIYITYKVYKERSFSKNLIWLVVAAGVVALFSPVLGLVAAAVLTSIDPAKLEDQSKEEKETDNKNENEQESDEAGFDDDISQEEQTEQIDINQQN